MKTSLTMLGLLARLAPRSRLQAPDPGRQQSKWMSEQPHASIPVRTSKQLTAKASIVDNPYSTIICRPFVRPFQPSKSTFPATDSLPA
ncbi:hypothetical protein SADUNF_Sadunf01G0141400 [Salix dunnii]|uniref:Uncharacterized protein n=1 Tax=Salix dunnii TaxID=1413687 RepID=A0A835TKH7_9ROSI|nr:hypothetical protein SADUNF_Sadunf01G0141400 [Salix dunnii]